MINETATFLGHYVLGYSGHWALGIIAAYSLIRFFRWFFTVEVDRQRGCCDSPDLHSYVVPVDDGNYRLWICHHCGQNLFQEFVHLDGSVKGKPKPPRREKVRK